MLQSILNFEIERVSKEINNNDLNKNFLGVFPSDRIIKFIMFEKIMPDKKYPFIILNTDKDSGTHWCSTLHISPKSELLFLDAFWISGMKRFIIDDDKKTVRKVLKELELAVRKDDQLILMKLKFSMTGYNNLTRTEVSNLSSTAQDFNHLVESLDKNEKITTFVNVWMLEDPT